MGAKFSKYLTRNVIITLTVLFMLCFAFVIYALLQIDANTNKTLTKYVPNARYPEYPTLDLKNKTKQQIKEIQRGEYLVKVGDCIACHTSPNTPNKPFAGGLTFQTPFGVLYSPNITPDKETGIGAWSDHDFVRAMHDGIAPSGYYYYPAFPYIFFNKITTADLMAIKAYLQSIPAINQKNKENDMMFPFNWRFLQLGWRIMFFYPERTNGYVYNPSQSDEWNKGKYYVQGLGHCAMCHSPSYYLLDKGVSLGAPIRKYDLTGQVIEGYLAPNISKSNIGMIPDEQLLEVFKQYKMLGGNPVEGPMKEAIHDSISFMKTEDQLAMITYLKSVDSDVPEDRTASASVMGRSIYNNYCAGCHNSGVGGAPRFGNKESWQTLANSGIKKLYRVAINGGGNMPARGGCVDCSDFKIELAVDYMVASSLKGVTHPEPKPVTEKDGEHVYKQYCASCHNNARSGAPQLGNKKQWAKIEDKGFMSAYEHIMQGRQGHPKKGGCNQCTDKEILSVLKYMLQKGSRKNRNYLLW